MSRNGFLVSSPWRLRGKAASTVVRHRVAPSNQQLLPLGTASRSPCEHTASGLALHHGLRRPWTRVPDPRGVETERRNHRSSARRLPRPSAGTARRICVLSHLPTFQTTDRATTAWRLLRRVWGGQQRHGRWELDATAAAGCPGCRCVHPAPSKTPRVGVEGWRRSRMGPGHATAGHRGRLHRAGHRCAQ